MAARPDSVSPTWTVVDADGARTLLDSAAGFKSAHQFYRRHHRLQFMRLNTSGPCWMRMKIA